MGSLKKISYKNWFMFAVIMFLSACMTMPAPKTVNQKIAYAKATGEGLNKSIVQLLNTDIITVDDAKRYRNEAVKVRIFLESAETYSSIGKNALAIDSWEKANTLLLDLNGILLDRAGGGL